VADSGPTLIGRYELHRALAAGGMATVHLGRLRSETGFGRTVALKRMHAHFAKDPAFVAMFFDEARLAMRLHHPNVVQTFDVVAAEGELLLVMEYIHGESLAGLLGDARVPTAIASSIVCGVLAGLHAAHETRGEDGAPLEIVHRDVSPQNILVGVDGVARLLDFGVAKAAGRLAATRQGQVKGKFGYMAPEQLTGERVDRRADVFAASVVLWEAVTGERLFKGDAPSDMVQAVLAAEARRPGEVVEGVPAALDEMVMRGLARQKRERFATAREMAVALEAAVAPATQRAVGEWVESLAAAALAKRAALVEEVEGKGRRAAGSVELQAPTVVEDRSGTDEVPSEVQAGPAPRRRGRRGWALAAALVVTVVAAGAMAMVKHAEVDPTPSPTASPNASPSPTPTPTPTPTPSPTPTATATATATTTATATAHARPRFAPSKPDCTNPFVVDSRGIRVPRPECF
jgi:serine/threonine protein kinase